MVRTIFDTNIYGKISEDILQGAELIQRIVTDPNFVIFNFLLIRDELRNAPKLLPLYDKLVSNKIIQETSEIKKLAKAYFTEYKANKGIQGQTKIMKDFKIVACASLKNCDLICSEDKRTMKSPIAVSSYKIINLRNNLRTPTFYSYEDLKKTYI